MSNVRWGLLSTANINRRLIPAIRASQRGELVAVASRTMERAQAYAREWDIPQAFGSYSQLLESGAIDALYISLPNHLHAEWTLQALQSGLHVLCEKPFALSLSDTDAMIAASRAAGRVLAEAFAYPHHPQTLLVQEWVRSGRLGDLLSINGAFHFTVENPQNIRLIPEYGGGSLWDVGVYPVSFAQLIMGEAPQSVFGLQQTGEGGVDEFFAGQLHYRGDRVAQFTCSFKASYFTFIEIHGTSGRLYLNRPFNYMEQDQKLVFYPNEGLPVEVPVPGKELFVGEVEDMNAAILDGKPCRISLENTRDHIRSVLALYESAKHHRICTLT